MTRDVKPWEPARRIENPRCVHYNRAVSTARISGSFPFLMASVLAVASGCEKKPSKSDTGAINALDRTSGSSAAVDTKPLANIDVSKLEGDRLQLFYKLVSSLDSPCGKAHSLRTSHETDMECKRAPFAARFVVVLLEDEHTEEQVRKEYQERYKSRAEAVQLDLSKAPRIGPDDAPVRLVEFFDYGCGACAAVKPELDAVAEQYAGKLAEYFLMYPLGSFPQSKSAAQAALAANAQGKFKEMHDLLFAKARAHGEQEVMGYARQLGLDLARFADDYKRFATQVDSDHAQGKAAGVDHTPTVFFNERMYEGPLGARYLGLYIEEELAVNR
jgi:protein-disulfide isomerase